MMSQAHFSPFLIEYQYQSYLYQLMPYTERLLPGFAKHHRNDDDLYQALFILGFKLFPVTIGQPRQVCQKKPSITSKPAPKITQYQCIYRA